MKTSIEFPAGQDKFSDADRLAVHDVFTIESNLDMTHRIKVKYLSNGADYSEKIESDLSLTESEKTYYKSRFEPIKYSSGTAGCFVNAANGDPVIPDETGNFPEGITVIPELELWQQLPPEYFSGANLNQITGRRDFLPGTTFAELVYNGLRYNMWVILQRGRI